MMNDEDLEWCGTYGNDRTEAAEAENASKSFVKVSYCREDLLRVVARIGGLEGADLIEDYKERTALIKINMGNLRLCQLDRGELLREMGSIDCLLATLVEVKHWIRCGERSETQASAWHLTIACWQALRDLACGSIGNRSAIRLYKHQNVSGLDLMTNYLELVEEVTWKDMDDLQIRLATAVIGAMRNASHGTYENCKHLHDNGATILLMGRLIEGTSSFGYSLPEQLLPWREGCFRAAGTLLNIAEEYDPCLKSCSISPPVISILLESWGFNKRLRGVFCLMLTYAKEALTQNEYNATWNDFK